MREPFFAGALCYPMQTADASVVTTKFLYYLLKNGENRIRENFVNRSGVPYINFKALMSYELPLPHSFVQHEIVRILDAFTSLTAELTAELTARKRQYAYYRDRLLTFGNEVPRVRLGEVCEFRRGQTITKKDVVEGNVPVIAGGREPAYYHNEANRTGETIAVAGSGAYAGFVSYWTIPVFLSDSFSVHPDRSLLSVKYVYYFLQSIQNEIYATKNGSGVPHVHGSSVAKFLIPLPPLQEQNRIASILDRFDALCNDLTDGLPAEIAARKKQYAHYRDKLLTFETGE